jgi:hypothetical protein
MRKVRKEIQTAETLSDPVTYLVSEITKVAFQLRAEPSKHVAGWLLRGSGFRFAATVSRGEGGIYFAKEK